MARTTEEALRVASRRAKVARLVLTGTTNQYEIAERLGMDPVKGQPQISRDISTIEAAWKASAIRDLDEAKGKELERLDVLESEYWAAWERSKRQRTRRRERASERPGKDGATYHETYAEQTKEKRDGNPKFLDGVEKCIKLRCQILSILQPEGTGATTVVTVVGGIDLAAVIGKAPGIPHDRISTGPN